MIVFLTGACGAGKTTLTNYLKATLPADEFEFYHSDDTPVPTTAEVEAMYTDGWDGWQKVNTRKWVDRLLPLQGAGKTIIWDGQTNMISLDKYLADYATDDYKIVVIECEPAEMFRRLIEERKQPSLATENQISWRNYLHQQGVERGCIILDTTEQKVEELAKRFKEEVLEIFS